METFSAYFTSKQLFIKTFQFTLIKKVLFKKGCYIIGFFQQMETHIFYIWINITRCNSLPYKNKIKRCLVIYEKGGNVSIYLKQIIHA